MHKKKKKSTQKYIYLNIIKRINSFSLYSPLYTQHTKKLHIRNM